LFLTARGLWSKPLLLIDWPSFCFSTINGLALLTLLVGGTHIDANDDRRTWRPTGSRYSRTFGALMGGSVRRRHGGLVCSVALGSGKIPKRVRTRLALAKQRHCKTRGEGRTTRFSARVESATPNLYSTARNTITIANRTAHESAERPAMTMADCPGDKRPSISAD
jgi:hypothetical protein